MIKYVIIHNMHEGCYDFNCYEDEEKKLRFTNIVINPPKIFMFDNKDQANEFFNDYINEVDRVDPKCKKEDDEIEHVDYCTCGILDIDDDGNPVLFYNKRNQIFFMETGGQIFMPPHTVKYDANNMNSTNKILRGKCRSLGREQRLKYIEIGKMCEECI